MEMEKVDLTFAKEKLYMVDLSQDRICGPNNQLQDSIVIKVFTAPNTMICCTVYTKGVRKNNTSTYTNLSLKHCIVKCALYQHYAVFEY